MHTYTNASTALHFVANEGKAGKTLEVKPGAMFYVPAGARLLLRSGGSSKTAAAAPPELLFNSSAVGGAKKPFIHVHCLSFLKSVSTFVF